MLDVLATFEGRAPAKGDGYTLGEMRPPPARGGVSIVPVPGANLSRYDVMEQQPGLFIAFSELPLTPEGFLDFANTYGSLFTSAPTAPAAEPFSAWRSRVVWMRHVWQVWALATGGRGQVYQLGGYVTWLAPDVFTVRVPDRAEAGHTVAPEDQWMFGEYIRTDLGEREDRGQVVGPAVAYVADTISEALARLPPPGIMLEVPTVERLGGSTRRGTMFYRPRNLWEALVVQLFLAVLNRKQFGRCRACKKWFVVPPGSSGANKVVCSPACRNRLYRQRQALAKEMYRQGRSAEEIARELDSDAGTVLGWVSDNKGG